MIDPAELDILASDTQSQLSSALITIRAKTATGELDTATGLRVIDLPPTIDTVEAVVSRPSEFTSEYGHRVRRVEFIVLQADLNHRPSRSGTVEWGVDDNGGAVPWRIVAAVDAIEGRKWIITCERDA